MSNIRSTACLLAFSLFVFSAPGKAAQAGVYAANDLLLFFQNPAGTTGTDKVVYFNLGSTFNVFRDAATPGSAAFGSTIPLGNINTILTSTYGADWTGLSSSIFLAAAGQNGSTSATSFSTSNGDFARTVYITKERTSLGSVGQANSASPLYAPSQTPVAGQIAGANNIDGMTQPGAVLADGTATTGNTLLDDYNPFSATGAPATAYGAINGGLMGSVTNASYTFGSVARVVSALDLYRVAKTSGTGTTSASIWHNANNIVATYSNDFGTAGGGSASAYYLGTITISSDGSVNFVARQAEPEIALAGDDLAGMTTVQGVASSHKSLTITANNIGTSDLTITLPAGFEVSTNGGTSYSATGTIAPTSGAVNTTVRVRMAATSLPGPLIGNVSVSAGGKTETKPISGSFGASVSVAGTLSSFVTTAGTASDAQTFSVSGSNLTGALTATAPSGFELRLAGSGSYGPSATIPPVSGTVAATSMEIRIAASAAAGLLNGTVNVSSSDATSATLSVSGTVNAAPLLTVSPSSISGLSATQGTVSAAETFTVIGANLTGNVTVAAPDGFEVSNGGGSYSGSLTLARTGGTLANTTISVRITAAANVGSLSGNITVSSSGASNKSVAVSGTVVPPPSIALAGILTNFTATQGTASTAQTFTVSGANLTGNVTVTAPANFEVSTDGTNFFPSRTLTQSGGSVASATISVRIAATAPNGSVSGNVTVSSTGAASQTLAASGTVGLPPSLSVLSFLVAFGSTQGTASAAQTFTVSGANLTGNVTVTAPANFEVSTDGTSFAGSRSLTVSGGSLGATTVSVRVKATALAGAVSGNITVSSTGATNQTVAVSGTVVPPPSVTTTGTLAAFSTTSGTASAAQTFTVSGANLTGDVTVTAPSGFELSSGGGSYAGSLTLTPSAGTLASTTVSVRLSAAASVGSPSGNIMVSSSGASSKTVAVSGTVVPAPSITVTGTLASFTATQGTASAAQTFSVSGANLSANVVVEVPANFEVSTDGTNFFTSRTLTQSNGSVASTTISVRIASTAPNGSVGGNVRISSGVATERTLTASGVVGSQPAVVAVSNFSPFTATQGTASSAQTFTVSGANLTGNVTVTAPANFEVSTDGTSFADSRSLTVSGGSLGATTVSVRIKATALAGAVSGNITVSSTGATSQTVAVSGTVVPPPSVTTTGTLDAFSTTAGTASAAQTFTVSGANLTGAVTVTAPSGFELSSGGGSYAGGLTLTPSAGTLASTTVSVRLSAAAAVGSPSGSITLSSSGASSKTVAVSGTVVPAPSITVTGTLASFTATQGTASAAQTFSVSGANLSANVVVEAPANFEVSTDGTNFFTSRTLTQSNGSVASTTISVRIASTAPNGSVLGNVTVSSAGAASQTLAASGTVGLRPSLSVLSSLVAFASTQGSASTAQTFTVSGANLTGNVTVTAPANFEVSTDGTSFAGSRSLTVSGGSLGATTVSVRVKATALAGAVSGNITVSSTGATNQTVAVSGTVVPPPSVTTTGTLAAFSTTAGTASAPQTFTVSGANLTGDVTVTAPSGFEVSNGGGSYAGSLTLTPSAGTLAGTTISVRLSAAASVGSPSGNITVSSGGASSKTVGVSGTVVPPPSLSTSGTLTSFTTTEGTASSVQTFTVSGSNLTGNVTVTAPSGFEVSDNGSSFSSSLSLTPSSGAVSASISVRVAAAAPPGPLSDNISVSTTGVASKTVSVNATVTAMPRINVVGSLIPFSAISGTASAEQTLQLSGANLTGNVTIVVPERFEVSPGSGQPFASSLTINPVSGSVVNLSIFIRLAASPVGDYTGDLDFSTTGATGIKVAVSGTVVPPPTVNGSANFVTFASTLGSASASQTFSVSGANLNAPVTVTAPTGYEVSLDNSSFGATQTINPQNGAVGSQVHIRIAATTGVGSPSGTVRISSTGATERSLPVNGKVVPPPLLTLSGTLPELTTRLGTASSGRTFSVSGSDLTGNVTVTAPIGFELTGQRKSYARTIVLTPSQGRLDVPVTVRISRTAALGNLSGNINVTSAGAAAKQIAVQGKVSAVPSLSLSGSLKAFNTTRGRPSASQNFLVSGSALNSVVFVTAPAGFQVSLDNANFASRVKLQPTNQTVSKQRIWIRLASATQARTLSGNITASSSGAATKVIRVSGRVR